MKRKQLFLLLTIVLSIPTLALAQSSKGYKYADDNATVFVNTEAFGVHKEYDNKRGCYVWKNSMGDFICLDKNMKPLSEMDKHVYFTGTNNDPDNPEVSPFSGVKKVWDKNRGCYVWKSSTGDFLGTDKKSVEEEDKKKAKEAAKQQKKEQEAHKQQQKKSDKPKKNDTPTKKSDKQKHDSNADIHNAQQMLITSDKELREAEAALKEAKEMYAAAKAEGIDLSEYNIDSYIKQAEDAINEYKRARNKMK